MAMDFPMKLAMINPASFLILSLEVQGSENFATVISPLLVKPSYFIQSPGVESKMPSMESSQSATRRVKLLLQHSWNAAGVSWA